MLSELARCPYQVPTSSDFKSFLVSGSSFELQLIENSSINNNAIKDIILGIELN